MIIKKMGKVHVEQCKLIEKSSFGGERNDDFLSGLANKNYLQYVAVESGIVVGYVVLLCVVDEIEIISIAVLPQYRGRGYSKELLNFVFDKAKKIGAVAIFLEVNEKNKIARGLYEKVGFVTISTRQKYYNNSEDAIIMKREI